MRPPRRCLGLRQRAAPFPFQKLVCPRSRRLAGSGKSVRFRQGRPAGMLRRRETSRFAGGRLPDGSRQLGGVAANALGDREAAHSRQPRPAGELPVAGHGPVLPRTKSPNGGWRRGGVKMQTPSGTGKPLAPDPTVSPGRSQQRDTARFCQRQNRQTVVGKGERQSANVTGHREAVRARQYRLTGKLPAAGYGPVLPRAKSPNGGWRRAVSKLKRFQRLSGARAPCSRRGGPGRWTAPAGRSRPPPPGRPGGG